MLVFSHQCATLVINAFPNNDRLTRLNFVQYLGIAAFNFFLLERQETSGSHLVASTPLPRSAPNDLYHVSSARLF